MQNLHGEMLHPYMKFPFAQNPIQMTKFCQAKVNMNLRDSNTVPPTVSYRIVIITMMMRKRILRNGAVRPVPTRSVRRPRSRTPRGEEDLPAAPPFSAGRPIRTPPTGPLPEEPHARFPAARTRRPTTQTQR